MYWRCSQCCVIPHMGGGIKYCDWTLDILDMWSVYMF